MAESRSEASPIPRVPPIALSLRGVGKAFARFPALRDIDLEVRPGELLALLGPSGSGKTTLLRVIAGLEFPDTGQVCFGEVDVTHAAAAVRGVGFVFQQYALFRHMTVAKNIAFGLEVRRRDKPARAERDRRVQALLALIEMQDLGQRRPSELSGGQRQRVALARALAVQPRVLLLDEPFGALDATVRKTLRRELRRIHDETGVTTVFVTHDQAEALELADRVAVMNKGRIEQVATPAEAQARPATAFVAGFVGEANRVEGEVRDGRFVRESLSLPAPGVADGAAWAFVQPQDLRPRFGAQDAAGALTGTLRGRLERISAAAGRMRLEFRSEKGELLEALTSDPPADIPPVGAWIPLEARTASVFPRA